MAPDLPPASDVILSGLVVLALVGISAFASLAETALLGFSKVRRRQLVDEKHPRIMSVERLMERPQRFLVTILIVNVVMAVAAAGLTTAFAFEYLGGWGALALGAVLTVLLLTFAEVTPKAYAAANPERVSLAVAPTVLGMQRALWPLVRAFEGLAEGIFRRTGQEGREISQFRSEEEIKTLITMGTEEGILEETEEEMLHSVIEFSETTVKEVMVPRLDMVAVPADAQLEHVRAFILDSGFSRIPVYQGSVDNVVGILYVKDVLLHLLEKRGNVTTRTKEGADASAIPPSGGVSIKDLMREPYFIPASKKLDDLLADMREKRVHMAIVIDEFGGTAGMITLEDVLEEIVGDIFDEYDLRSDPIRKLDDVTAVVDARTHVADVNDALDLEIPEDEGYDTVAGYVHHALGRLGKEGEVVHGDRFDIVVEKVSNRRILRVRFVKHRPTQRSEDEIEEASVE